MKDQLLAYVGKNVRVTNRCFVENDNSFSFNIVGTLEAPSDEGDPWFVRAGEDYYAGSLGVCFVLANVAELEVKNYGDLEIVLK